MSPRAGPRCPLTLAAAAALLLASGEGLSAQVGVALETGAVHALPPAGSEARALTYGSLDLHGYFSPAASWTLSGGGAGAFAFDGDGSWLVGDLASVGRRPIGRRGTLELTTSLAAFRVSTASVYEATVARAVPAFRWRTGGSAEVVFRGHAGWGRSVSRVETSEVRENLTLLGGGVEGSVTAGVARLRASTDAYHTEAGASWTVLGGGELPLGDARLTGEVQLWSLPGSSRDQQVVFLGSVSIPLGGRASLRSSGGRSAPDPLLRTLPGTYGSVLLHLDLPVGGGASLGPAVRLVDAENGLVRFEWRDAADEAVEVLGDFSDWTPIPLERAGGTWSAEVQLPPGVHHFSFRVDGRWSVPEEVLGLTVDEWGRPAATVVVPHRSSAVSVGQGPGEGVGSLDPTTTPAQLRAWLLTATRDGLPSRPLVDKAREGMAKGAPPEELLRAVQAYAEDLERARGLLGEVDGTDDLTAAGDALRRGVPDQALRELAPALQGTGRTLSLVALGDLVGDGVPAQSAFDLVFTAGERANAAVILPSVPPTIRRLVRQGWTPTEAAAEVERAIARGTPPPFVALGAGGASGRPPVPPGTGTGGMMGTMRPPGD